MFHRWSPLLVLLTLPALSAGAPQPDARGTVAPARAYDILALHLDTRVDPVTRTVQGTARYKARRLHDAPLVLDRVDIDITAVRGLDTAPPPHRLRPGHLVIDATTDHIGEDGTLDFEIDFVARPWTGVHFRGDAPADRFSEVWTQGQLRDHQHWFPAWDHPNDRFDYTGTISGPPGWRAVTNSGHDLPTYLIMFAMGPYDEHVHSDDPSTRVWVAPGTARDAIQPVLDPVPAMKAHFAERTGMAYPWGDYLQVFVQRFLYGGMENTGATINSDRALVSSHVQTTRPRIETLVAHELAHQWFGDLLTCRTWRDLWLNEGFATFMAADYVVERHGSEQAQAAARAELVDRWYARSRAQPHPMARRWHHGAGPDNHNVYSRGAATLWMLQSELGEAAFWAGVRRYVAQHAHGSVETVDLRRAFESETGRDLTGFFQQWTETTGSPELSVQERRTDDTLVVTVQQKRSKDRPLFHLPVEVHVSTDAGVVTARDWMDGDTLQLRVPVQGTVRWVAIDPRGAVLADWKHKQSAVRLEAMASEAPAYARIQAIRALGETDAATALTAILADETAPPPFRRAAADALGEQRNAHALQAAAITPVDEVRLAVAKALGQCAGTVASDALRRLASSDPNPDVRGAALSSLARVSPATAVRLARQNIRLGGHDNIRLVASAAGVLGEYGSARDLKLLTDARLPLRNRVTALEAAAGWVQQQPDDALREAHGRTVARSAEALLDDADLRTRQRAIGVLRRVGDASSIPKLEAHRRATRVEQEQTAARAAVRAIRTRDRPEYVDPEAERDARLAELEERIDTLEKELERWEDHHTTP